MSRSASRKVFSLTRPVRHVIRRLHATTRTILSVSETQKCLPDMRSCSVTNSCRRVDFTACANASSLQCRSSAHILQEADALSLLYDFHGYRCCVRPCHLHTSPLSYLYSSGARPFTGTLPTFAHSPCCHPAASIDDN
jgi:hypothetical protein